MLDIVKECREVLINKGKMEGKREGIEEGRKEGRREGRREGKREGRKEGREGILTAFTCLRDQGRFNDLDRALTDRDYLNQILAEFGLEEYAETVKPDEDVV